MLHVFRFVLLVCVFAQVTVTCDICCFGNFDLQIIQVHLFSAAVFLKRTNRIAKEQDVFKRYEERY
jgi:hypothetical protein